MFLVRGKFAYLDFTAQLNLTWLDNTAGWEKVQPPNVSQKLLLQFNCFCVSGFLLCQDPNSI